MKIPLNKSRSSRMRYYLIKGKMGGAGEPETSVNNRFMVVNGVDRGNGYQGYMSVSYALSLESYMPAGARAKLKAALKSLGVNV